MEMLPGILAVGIGGLFAGGGAWPYKLMRQFQFEHWWFIGNFIALFIAPWTVTLLGCPDAIDGFRSVPVNALIKANLLSLAWGLANILCGLCYLRIGVALTGAILAGLGVCVGTIAPLVIKGTGQFRDAAGLGSPAGRTVLTGLAVMLVGVLLATLAGFGRDRQLQSQRTDSPDANAPQHRFVGGLLMTALAGILSAGMALSFVYSQGPVVEAMKLRGAGDIAASYAVWAIGLLGGGVLNVGYAAYLLTRNKSWHVFAQSGKDLALALIIGINSIFAIVLLGKGMLWLGALGASIGFGIQQAMQMTGCQAVGFVSGEWRGVRGTPRLQMYLAIAVLVIAASIMAYGNRMMNL